MKITYNDFEKTALELLSVHPEMREGKLISVRPEMREDRLIYAVIENHRQKTIEPFRGKTFMSVLIWAQAKKERWLGFYKYQKFIDMMEEPGRRYISHKLKLDDEDTDRFYHITHRGRRRLADLRR